MTGENIFMFSPVLFYYRISKSATGDNKKSRGTLSNKPHDSFYNLTPILYHSANGSNTPAEPPAT